VTTTVLLREAVAADVAAIATLVAMGHASRPMDRAAARIEAAHPAYAAAFDAVSASRDTHLYVVVDGEAIVGTFQLTVMPGLAERGQVRGKIESVHVDPDRRGQGIGAIMMAHAIAEARRLGIGLLELSSNKVRKDAHRFYERLGFARSHEGFKMAL
jgi:GNAT superfamily N-acetyltransferase